MIRFITGDIFDAKTDAIVNTVNCVGVMGRGIALQFKQTYPDNFTAYKVACQHGEIVMGRMFVFETGQILNPRWIINFPTKQHWREKSRLEDIDTGLADLVEEIRKRNIHSIAIPPLGSGLGRLNWSDVRSRIEQAFAGVEDVEVIVFEPDGKSTHEVFHRSPQAPKMTPGRAAQNKRQKKNFHENL